MDNLKTFTVTKDDTVWSVMVRGGGSANGTIAEEIRNKINDALERGDVVLIVSVPLGVEVKVSRHDPEMLLSVDQGDG